MNKKWSVFHLQGGITLDLVNNLYLSKKPPMSSNGESQLTHLETDNTLNINFYIKSKYAYLFEIDAKMQVHLH